MLYERGLNAFSKYVGLGQPAQPAQADLGRYFLLLFAFPHITRPFFKIIQSADTQNDFLRCLACNISQKST